MRGLPLVQDISTARARAGRVVDDGAQGPLQRHDRLSWHMMVEFEPPRIACVVSGADWPATAALKAARECVIAIPAAGLASKVVGTGNCSGRTVDKFQQFDLTPLPAGHRRALIEECFANLECRVIDTRLVKDHGIFVLEVVEARRRPSAEAPGHHHPPGGYGRARGGRQAHPAAFPHALARASRHLAEGLAKAPQRQREQRRADGGQPQEGFPHHVQPRAAIQDGLAQADEVRGRGPASSDPARSPACFRGRGAAREHLQRQQGQHHSSRPTLRHAARQWRERCPWTWWRTATGPRRPGRGRPSPVIGTCSSPRTTRRQRHRRGQQHHQPHRPDLGDHDLGGRHRHDQQMLDGAVLALADERRAGQDDGQHGHRVDDLA